jgi:LicD family
MVRLHSNIYWLRPFADTCQTVQMSESSMHYLAEYYNMTIHHFKLPGISDGRDYMLEINPHYKNGSITDFLNVIDGRWIDTETGLFIDITTLRRNTTAEEMGLKGVMMCKDKHHYLEKDIFPLRESAFENTPVKIPYAYTELLEEEYGAAALTSKNFMNHYFDTERMEWLPNGYVTKCIFILPPQLRPQLVNAVIPYLTNHGI